MGMRRSHLSFLLGRVDLLLPVLRHRFRGGGVSIVRRAILQMGWGEVVGCIRKSST